MSQFKSNQVVQNLTRARICIDKDEEMTKNTYMALDALWQTVFFLISELNEEAQYAQQAANTGGPEVLKFNSPGDFEKFMKDQRKQYDNSTDEEKEAYEKQKSKSYL